MRRKYWISPELYKSQVSVKSIGNKLVRIEPNIFHPNEGGQPSDRGTIGGVKVVSVEMKDGFILIELGSELDDGNYDAVVDMEHRLFTSRLHTAQHIISGIAESELGLKTVGVHIGDNSTIDFDKSIEMEDIEKLESISSDIVMRDLPVETSFGIAPTRFDEHLEGIDKDDLRVVSIGSIDSSACCGAHVSTTGRVGLIRIISSEKKRGGSRITFLVGSSAVTFSRNETNILSNLRKLSSCSSNELEEKYSSLMDENKSMNREIIQLWKQILPSVAGCCDVLSIDGQSIGLVVEPIPNKLIGKLMAMITEKYDCGIIISDRSISINTKSLSAKELLNRITDKIGGKGGGKDRVAKGILSKSITLKELRVILL